MHEEASVVLEDKEWALFPSDSESYFFLNLFFKDHLATIKLGFVPGCISVHSLPIKM